MAWLQYPLSTLHEERHRPRARLVSGWLLAFTVGESNPVDRDRRFQSYIFVLLLQACPGASWAHLIRKYASFAERNGRVGEIGRELLFWSRHLIHMYHRVRDGTLPRAALQRASSNIRAHVERLLEEGRDLSVKGVSGSCRDILDHREAMWRFIDDPAVEPTNNHGERELRSLVTWRKSSFGSQSERGNTFAANLKSVIQTCRKQQRNVLEYLRTSVHAALRHESTPSLLRPTP